MPFDGEVVLPIIIACVIFGLGIQMMRGKLLMLIAGYNTMGKEKRAKVNGPDLGKAMGTFLIYISGLIVIAVCVPSVAEHMCWLILLPLAGLLVYVNTSSRFKK